MPGARSFCEVSGWSGQINRDSPQAQGLVGWWPLNEAVPGLAIDRSGGNVRSSVVNGGPTTKATSIGRMLSLDGTDDVVYVGNRARYKVPLPLTISAIVVPRNFTNYTICFGTDDFGASGSYYGAQIQIRASTAGAISLHYGDGTFAGSGARRSKTTTNTLALAVPQRIVGVIRADVDMDVYIDAVDAGGSYSGSGGAAIGYSSTSGAIGYDGADGTYFPGEIADVRVYARALTAGDVRAIQENPYDLYWVPRRSAPKKAAVAAGSFSTALFRANAGLGAVGGGPFARANAGVGAVA